MSKPLRLTKVVQYCQDVNEPLRSDPYIMSDDEIDAKTSRQLLKAIHGIRPRLIGAESTGWTEPKPHDPCPHCDDGRKIDGIDYAICLACTRASKHLAQAIKRAAMDQEYLTRFYHPLRLISLKTRSMRQKWRITGTGPGNHGADPGRGAKRVNRPPK